MLGLVQLLADPWELAACDQLRLGVMEKRNHSIRLTDNPRFTSMLRNLTKVTFSYQRSPTRPHRDWWRNTMNSRPVVTPLMTKVIKKGDDLFRMVGKENAPILPPYVALFTVLKTAFSRLLPQGHQLYQFRSIYLRWQSPSWPVIEDLIYRSRDVA